MKIWTLSDLHLAFGAPQKKMDVFGGAWIDYANKIEKNWKATVQNEDLVLIPGDISWATKLEDAAIDLQWIDQLPGTKLLLKGNHDYWWTSLSKVQKILPPSLHLLQNNAFNWHNVSIAGSRLWDTFEYHFDPIIHYVDNPRANELHKKESKEESEKIFERELLRLEMSLKCLDKNAKHKIAMTHYPPIGLDLAPSRASTLLEKYGIEACVFGHLHNVIPQPSLFGEARGVRYYFASGDYLNFIPASIALKLEDLGTA